MGNEQSNEKKREYKVYRITGKEEHEKWHRYFLDRDVPYKDGNYARIDFERRSDGYYLLAFANNIIGDGNSDLTGSFDVGDFIKIDTEMIRQCSSSNNFNYSRDWLVGKVMWDEGEQSNIIRTTGEWLQEISEHRELRANAMQEYRAFQQANEWHTKPK